MSMQSANRMAQDNQNAMILYTCAQKVDQLSWLYKRRTIDAMETGAGVTVTVHQGFATRVQKYASQGIIPWLAMNQTITATI